MKGRPRTETPEKLPQYMCIRERGGRIYYYARFPKEAEVYLGSDEGEALKSYQKHSESREIAAKIALEIINPATIEYRKKTKSCPAMAAIIHKKATAQANSRNIPYLLSEKDVENILVRSEGRCEFSGIPFDMRRSSDSRVRPWAPSLDRINSDGEYTVDNVRVVCTSVNIALNEFGDAVLIRIAHGIMKKQLRMK